MWLQVVFLIQSFYGWYFWVNGKKEDIENVPIRTLDSRERILSFISIVILIGIVGYLSDHYSNTDVPYLDATVASISLIANILLARKVLDNWVLWILADVMYIGLFYYKELYVISILYLIFLGISTSGLIQWRKEWKLQEA